MRRRVFRRWVGLVLTGALGVVGACGIDESGLEGVDASMDVTTNDTSPPPKDAASDAPFDVVIAQGCTTLDATACLDADVPDGWTLVGLATSNVTCPEGDAYAPSSYLDNLQLEAGVCTCECAASGSYNCAGTINYAWAGGCNNSGKDASFDAGPAAMCIPTNENDQHLEIFGPLPTPTPVNVTCDASTVVSAGWTANQVTTCTPSCAADYCNIPGPFSRCIISTTETTCPAPFQPSSAGPIGPAGAVVAQCNGCGCSNDAPGGCDASFYANKTNNCMMYQGLAPIDTCQDFGGGNNINSIYYQPYPPQLAGCQTSGGGGNVAFNPGITVCCLP